MKELKIVPLDARLSDILDEILNDSTPQEDRDTLTEQGLAFSGYLMAIITGPPGAAETKERIQQAVGVMRKYMLGYHAEAETIELLRKASSKGKPS